jgi:hypothetical protein
MKPDVRKRSPHLVAFAAVVALSGCEPQPITLPPDILVGGTLPSGPAAFEPTCEVVSCSLASGAACTVGTPEPRRFSVPNRAAVVFRSEIPAGAGVQAPYTFVWRFDTSGPTARPPAGNDRESRVQHVYDLAGEKRITVTVTDGRGAVHEGSPSCRLTVLAASAGAGTPR